MDSGGTNASETMTLPPEAEATDNLWRYLGVIIIIVGTISHTLSIMVLVSSKTLRNHSSTVYLVAMSLAGVVSLYTGLLRYVVLIGWSEWTLDIRSTSDAFCRIHMNITYASLQYFAWLQATIAVDRLVSVLLPHKYMTSCKWFTGLIVVIVELVVVLLLNSALAIKNGLSDSYCGFPDKKFKEIWGYADLISYSLLPAVVMVVCNSVILHILNRSKMKTGRDNSMARSLTVMLMSLNVIFLITTLPISVIFFIPNGEPHTRRYYQVELCWTIFSLLQYMGSACTFFIYCITGSKFRAEFLKLPKTLCGLKLPDTRKNSITVTTNCRQSPSPKNYRSLKVSLANNGETETDADGV